MPSQPHGLGSDGLQVVSRWAVALKASLSSSNASPATQASLLVSKGSPNRWKRKNMSVRTVRGEGQGCRGAEEGGNGDDGGAQARLWTLLLHLVLVLGLGSDCLGVRPVFESCSCLPASKRSSAVVVCERRRVKQWWCAREESSEL
jgi:hypothetical protein